MSGTIDLVPRSQGGPLITPDYLDSIVNGALVTKSPIAITATGSTTARAIPDRFADWLNVKDFGAKIDGAADDTPALNASLTAATANSTILIPHGSGAIHYIGGNISAAGPSGMVHWKLDGPLAEGVSTITGFLGTGRLNKGDLVENFRDGTKYLTVAAAAPDMYGVLRIDYNLRAGIGTPGGVATILRVNTQDNAAAQVSQWGIHVAMDSFANPAPGSPWPQNVGISSTVTKHGFAWSAGHHVGAADVQNVDSLTGGTMLGMEMGLHVNKADNGFNAGTVGNEGIRIGIKIGVDQSTADAANESEVGWAVHASCGTHARFRSVFGVANNMITYQVLDARGAQTAPSGYTDPIAAVRMQHEQIIDFNGSTSDARANAGAYLQYTTTGTARLRYMVGATERFTLPDTKPTVTGAKGSNAALASLLTALVAANLITDSTSA